MPPEIEHVIRHIITGDVTVRAGGVVVMGFEAAVTPEDLAYIERRIKGAMPHIAGALIVANSAQTFVAAINTEVPA